MNLSIAVIGALHRLEGQQKLGTSAARQRVFCLQGDGVDESEAAVRTRRQMDRKDTEHPVAPSAAPHH
jgi:hypothetical protein